ncbi:DNA topoisomerase 3 [Shewanella septentrionalis]|uniref:DNA topoisomerase n=1 Tax=Shewanella septentrionalis TaxID=2952223 RepID=A0A9X2WYD5_9GAMM|nr:DNA topoisomerase 3 [Shewanella septentrionalis]MCT7947698.1 DNA topoisomerase 3 [Shewanella septentrionalis]
MRVFFAEKPSLAQAIFEGLGGNPNAKMTNGYFEIGDNKVTSCFGHMLELFDPEDYDENLQKWSMDDLPIKAVYPPKLKPKEDAKQRLDVIFSLIKQADEIVHAGDADEEGQLLVDEILLYANNTKPVKRVLIADLNLKPVQKALANLKPNSEFEHLGHSALARSIGDQVFGYNLTRGFTLQGRKQGFDGVLNVGRVQSAVLGLINSRTLANQSHIESFYYDAMVSLSSDAGALKAKYQPSDSDIVDEKNRIIDEANAKRVQQDCEQQSAIIKELSTKQESKAAPQPYNLSTLQQTCAKKWGYSADETLETVQSLYETHKLTTYPRADCRFLSDEHLAGARDIFSAIADTMPKYTQSVQDADLSLVHKAFNTEKITAHHAIIPTEKSGANITLTPKEKNIYELIATSFIALFYADSVRDKTRAVIECNGREFVATQSVLQSQGWETLFKGEIETDQPIEGADLANMKKGQTLTCGNVSIDKKKNTPPKYFVESSLLAAMTRAAKFIEDPELRKALEAKDKNNAAESGSIGTEATRAGILTKLAENIGLVSIEEEKGYKEKVWKTTQQGQEFCAVLPKEIIAPDTSAIWSQQQVLIREGKLTVKEFVSSLDDYLEKQIAALKTNGITITPNMTLCPICKKGYLGKRKGTNGVFWGCNNHPECKTAYPDNDGKPNLTVKPKRPLTVSNHKCPNCEKGLIRRKRTKLIKGKVSYFWSCSGYPDCTITMLDRAGKPHFESARMADKTTTETAESED